jgi:DNA-binding HxlR family transcriptional regulator
LLALERISSVTHAVRVRRVPAIECALALWAARAPEREPLVKSARKMQARMSGPVQRRALELDRKLPGWPLRVANSFFRLDAGGFADALERIVEEDPRRLALDFVLASVARPDTVPVPWDDEASLERALASPSLSEAARRSAQPMFREPYEIVGTVVDVMNAFWRAGFGDSWQAQSEARRRNCLLMETQLQTSTAQALANISARGVYDEEADRVVFLGGQATRVVRCDGLESLDVIPSLWMRRRIALSFAPRRAAINVASGRIVAERLPLEGIPQTLAVLGDARRFEIVRLCTARARSTTELAGILNITEGPVSRHLKTLERQGLVVGQRFGREVTYAAVPEVIALLGRQLQRLHLGELSSIAEGGSGLQAA